MNRLLPLLLSVALGACSYLPDMPLLGGEVAAPEPTLADLQPAAPLSVTEQMPALSLEELGQAYRQVLAVTENPELQLNVRHRLADLEMLAREAESVGADGPGVSYAGVIASYQSLLSEYPDVAGTDQLMYQMARAYDLDGQAEEAVALMAQLSSSHPDSEHVIEAEFRKGDAHFSAGEYALAAQAYEKVVAGDTDSEYYANSLYMLGWSLFKQERNHEAVRAFTATLDHLMPVDDQWDAMPRGDREMATDCFRVQAVIFDQWGGSEAIAVTYRRMGERAYQHRVYDALGQLYLQQERFQDSAATYAGFILEYPLSPAAPGFQRDIIKVYQAAGFPQQVIAAKEDYVTAYGVTGDYWSIASEAQRELILPHLAQYVDELARHYHALAQSGEGEAAHANYLRAAGYYELYVASFPTDARVPDMAFLMAESRDAAGEYRRAIRDYQNMAYRYPGHPKAAEAGYAALLAYGALDSAEREDRLAMIDSQLRFSAVFPKDPRATVVLANAASSLLDEGLYYRAALSAADLTVWQPTPQVQVLLPAWLVLAHAEFELDEFADAERAYQQALELLPARDERRPDAVDRLATSIYRQGEAASAEGAHQQAAQHFVRVMQVAPGSAVSLNAQYDAANSYLLAGEVAQANDLLVDFRQRYPEHELTAGIGARLVENHERTGDWQAAAAELDIISESSDDPAVQREALYLAADYYRRAGSADLSMDRYRRYAHTWKTPLAPRMEAMLILADMYAERGETPRRHYWLRAMADACDLGKQEADERSRYLAASATSELADVHYHDYLAIALSQPLTTSLPRKREAMDRTVAAYEKVNGYGVQEFGTRATYRLAQVYRQLSAALMDSPRPGDLDALALEQYELLLEEQAWPFEQKAVSIHEINAQRAWDGLHDAWIEQSFTALGELMPARWGKRERRVTMSTEIR